LQFQNIARAAIIVSRSAQLTLNGVRLPLIGSRCSSSWQCNRKRKSPALAGLLLVSFFGSVHLMSENSLAITCPVARTIRCRNYLASFAI
jgi:hypothetical protein